MSRSYKKHPYYKIGDPSFKKIFNRRLRRSSKIQDIPSGKAYRKYNDIYSLCDWKVDCSWEEFREWNWVRTKYFDSEEKAYAYWKKHYGSK